MHTLGIQWQNPLTIPKLSAHEIHIWKAELDIDDTAREKLFALLSATEKARAARFKFPIHRERYIVSQGNLRKILSCYLAIAPEDIQFSQGAHGKPYATSEKNIYFNLSNSQNLALYAVLLDQEVGIDLEYFRDKVSYTELTERFFSTEEKNYFSKLPAEQQKEAFFRLWTSKEAFIKAVGEGLSFPLEDFTIDIEKPKIVTIKGDNALANTWHLKLFTPAEHYVAAVACQKCIEKWLFFQP